MTKTGASGSDSETCQSDWYCIPVVGIYRKYLCLKLGDTFSVGKYVKIERPGAQSATDL